MKCLDYPSTILHYIHLVSKYDLVLHTTCAGMAEHFSNGGGGGGLTSDLKWGAEETLL